MKKLLYFILILSIFSISAISFADMQIQVQDDEINVETIPNNPEPYQNVTINITSYATDLNKAAISWQSNKGIVLSGIGKTSYSFKTDGPNTTNTFNISITPSDSITSINKKVVINPSEIEVIWESVNGYTPPFYKGKTLPTSGSKIKVVAIPNTNTIKSGAGSISYTWKNLNDTILDASGYNKNSYIFKNDMFDKTNKITVTASSVDGSYAAENTANIPIYSPKIIFYKKSPTEGTFYNNALTSDTTFSEDEMTLVAEPYFLATKGSESKFNYSWNINGDQIATPSKKTEITIRPTSRGGYADISVTMENISELFQTVTGQLKLTL